jgi:hypothetical protein
MYNMILEDERNLGRIDHHMKGVLLKLVILFHVQRHQILCHLLRSMKKFVTQIHHQLKNDLVEHLWQRH